MSKNKESSSSKNEETDDCLSSYINMKSPLIGQLQFDVSVLPPPVDPRFVDYEINNDHLDYEVTGVELSERLSYSSDFDAGVSDELLLGTGFSGCGVENRALMESLESKFFDKVMATGDTKESCFNLVRDDVFEMMKYFDNLKMTSTLTKAKETLPQYLQNILSPNFDLNYIRQKKAMYMKKDEATQIDKELKVETYDSWENMNLDEKVEAYVSALEKTFVSHDQLRHPINKSARIARVYDLVPNYNLWDNSYIQVGIDGVTQTSEARSKLETDGVLMLAKETQTQRFFEYYKKYVGDSFEYSFSNPSYSSDSTNVESVNMDRVYDVQKVVQDDFDELFEDKGQEHEEHTQKQLNKEHEDKNTTEEEQEDDNEDEDYIDDLFKDPEEDKKEDKLDKDFVRLKMEYNKKEDKEDTNNKENKEKQEDKKENREEESSMELDTNQVEQYRKTKNTTEEQKGDLYKFIRQYTSQKISKTHGSENYYMLSLPDRVNHLFNRDHSKSLKEDGSEVVKVVPVRGPRMVFSKAGVTKRPDIWIEYLES